MDNFIEVTAKRCNSQGHITSEPTVTLLLNTDLIGGIMEYSVFIKGGEILFIGGHHFRDFQILKKIPIRNKL